MKSNPKGFTVVEILLSLVVVAAVATGGWWVWHNNKKTPTNTSTVTQKTTPQNFDECVDMANITAARATLDEKGQTLTCFWKKKKFTHDALAPIKTISASFFRPTFGELPNDVKQFILTKSGDTDCNNNKVTMDSQSNSAVKAMKAGNFILIAIGCDGAQISAFKFSSDKWSADLTNNNYTDFTVCQYVESRQLPIELLKHTFDTEIDIQPKCTDAKYIEHSVVTE